MSPGRRQRGRSVARGAVLATIASVLLAAKPVCADVFPIAVLRALDKVTARVSTLYAPVGETVRFGTLEITTEVCDKRPPEEPPESAVFLQIVEKRSGQPSTLGAPGLRRRVLDCVSSLPSAPAKASDGGSL
ncbi:MAG: DUF2155 domain-containing protein [Rhodospirillales bacterium]|nr:DUF2155 domain-containing protein [Rhodospirillales bacterium]